MVPIQEIWKRSEKLASATVDGRATAQIDFVRMADQAKKLKAMVSKPDETPKHAGNSE